MPSDRVEIWPRPLAFVPALVVGLCFLTFPLWSPGRLLSWIVATVAGVLLLVVAFQLARNRPRLTLSEEGISWIGGQLTWSEIDVMQEMTWGRWPSRFRFLAIRTVDRSLGNRWDRALFKSSFTINVRGLRLPAETVFKLVEQFSGRGVMRIA